MNLFNKTCWFKPVIILLLIIIPICVNYILSREKVCNYDVVGNGVDWISFYGSYLGSVLTASIAFYVLQKTIETEKWIDRKNQKIRQYELLRDDLSDRISRIELTDVFRVIMYRKNFDAKEEMDRLISLLYNYKAMSNSSMLRYGLDEDDRCVDFFEEYNSLIADICIAINSMMRVLANYIETNDKVILESELSIMNGVMKELNKRPEIVFKRAQVYCLSKKKELNV